MKIQTRTVHVGNISDLAGEREIREFFSFSGEIEHVEIRSGDVGALRTAFVTFKDPKALEIALLLSGATIVDQLVSITAIENYAPKVEEQAINGQATNVTLLGDDVPTIEAGSSRGSGHIYVSKAQEVVTSMLARGSAIRQDAVSKAKEFDEKHRLSANTSAKVISFDKRVGLSEKITVGISVVMRNPNPSSHQRKEEGGVADLEKMGRVRTKTVKKSSRQVIERYYSRMTLDFHTNKKVIEEVAIIPSKRLRNKIAGFSTHLMRRIQRGPVRGISLKLQEEERERRMDFVPEESAIKVDQIEVDKETIEMLASIGMADLPGVEKQQDAAAQPAYGGRPGFAGGRRN